MGDENASSEAPERYTIGISFGNSNSSIAHISGEGKVEVIANEEGDRQIPSILSYVEGEEYHGTQAKSQLVRNSKNTIAYFKEFVGKDFKAIDPTACQYSAHPIDNSGTTAFSIQDTSEETENTISVSEIATRHFRKLRTSAADYTGKNVSAAVLTVPTDTTDDQKVALSKAAQDAGIEILQCISEPVAALLAYDSRSSDLPGDKLALVADFGGTRSDVAIIASRDGMYTYLATAHDYNLGGSKLDEVLNDYFAKEFMKKHKTDPRTDQKSLAKLRLESESVKKALSQSASATFSVESLAGGNDFRATINRTRYDLLAANTLRSFTRLVEEAIRKADLDVLDIDQVILSGGTSNTPRIASNLQSLFPSTTSILAPSTTAQSLNPSELSSRGAALQASLIQEFDKEDIDQSTHEMVTITPHLTNAIGVVLDPLKPSTDTTSPPPFLLLVPSFSAVPVRRTRSIPVPASGGDVVVKICEASRDIKVSKPEPRANGVNKSENDDAEDSDADSDEDEQEEIRTKRYLPNLEHPLCELVVKGVKKRGKVEVTVNVNADLSVNISAREVGAKGGVRADVKAPEVVENGKA